MLYFQHVGPNGDFMKKRRLLNDTILIALLILIPVAMLIFSSTGENNHDGTVLITVDGKIYERLPLADDVEITVVTSAGINYVIIRNGEVWVSDADCPNKTCVNHRAISKAGEQIVCLPHKMVLEIMDKDDKDIDSLSQ